MNSRETSTVAFPTKPGAAQPAETSSQYADLVIGGLLVALAIGGFAM